MLMMRHITIIDYNENVSIIIMSSEYRLLFLPKKQNENWPATAAINKYTRSTEAGAIAHVQCMASPPPIQGGMNL